MKIMISSKTVLKKYGEVMSFYKNTGAAREVKKQKLLDNFNDWLWWIQIRDLEWSCENDECRFEEEEISFDHCKNIHWVLRYLCRQALGEDIQSPRRSILIKLYLVLCELYLENHPGKDRWQTIRGFYEDTYGCEIYDDFQIRSSFDAEVQGAFDEFEMFTEFLSGSSGIFKKVNKKVLELR